MSVDIKTDLGTIRKCKGTGDEVVWLLRCPVCENWERLSEDQMEGRVSVNHAATGCPSGYHETHNFAIEIVAKIQAHALAPYGDDPVVRS